MTGEFVTIVHPGIEQPGTCALSALGLWRQKGWRPVDPEHMTPTEMVEQRVRDLERAATRAAEDRVRDLGGDL